VDDPVINKTATLAVWRCAELVDDMCYIILPVAAFVLLVWSSAAALFGLWSTDWFVGDNIHMGIASGCPASDSVTVPFNIPSQAGNPSSNSTITFCDSVKWYVLPAIPFI
jgi:hypothetical protein